MKNGRVSGNIVTGKEIKIMDLLVKLTSIFYITVKICILETQ